MWIVGFQGKGRLPNFVTVLDGAVACPFWQSFRCFYYDKRRGSYSEAGFLTQLQTYYQILYPGLLSGTSKTQRVWCCAFSARLCCRVGSLALLRMFLLRDCETGSLYQLLLHMNAKTTGYLLICCCI